MVGVYSMKRFLRSLAQTLILIVGITFLSFTLSYLSPGDPAQQMMDADDPENTNGGSQNFKPYHTEDAGFNTDAASADSTVQTFTFTGGNYTGNIYNASGSDGLEGTTLNVTFGEGAEYTGAIASTSAIHVTYDGSVAVKAVNVILTDDAVWNETATSVISALTIEGGAQVAVPEDVTLTVNGVEYTNCTLTAQDL